MDKNATDKKIAELEAFLFVHGEPVSLKRIAGILGLDTDETKETILELEKRLSSPDRGIILVSDDSSYQLATKPEFGEILKRFVDEEFNKPLTPASSETLAIVTYLGPISRSRIDYLRGVNSSFILRNLMIRGLIERSADTDRSNAYLYKPSFELLRHLGVGKKEDLPDYEKFHLLFEEISSGEHIDDDNLGSEEFQMKNSSEADDFGEKETGNAQ